MLGDFGHGGHSAVNYPPLLICSKPTNLIHEEWILGTPGIFRISLVGGVRPLGFWRPWDSFPVITEKPGSLLPQGLWYPRDPRYLTSNSLESMTLLAGSSWNPKSHCDRWSFGIRVPAVPWIPGILGVSGLPAAAYRISTFPGILGVLGLCMKKRIQIFIPHCAKLPGIMCLWLMGRALGFVRHLHYKIGADSRYRYPSASIGPWY